MRAWGLGLRVWDLGWVPEDPNNPMYAVFLDLRAQC